LEGYSIIAHNYPSESDRLNYSRFYDINGDGWLDFVASEGSFEPGRYVQDGQPDGTFGPSYFLSEEEIQTRFETNGIVEYWWRDRIFRGDFNEDGLLDQIQQTPSRTWRVSLADSTGELTAIQEIQLSGRNVWMVGVEDVDGDSHIDLILAEPDPDTAVHRRVFMRGDGTGHFSPGEVYSAPHAPTTYHRNGGVSLTIHEDSSIFDSWRVPQIAKFQLPIPNQSGVQPGSGGPSHDAVQIDVDGDGDLDVLVAHGSGVAVVLAVGEGDFDEDGKLTMDDFAILARNFGLEEAKREQGDANGDGKVDFKDFVAFARGFSRL
jgi:hypothetical protein